MFKKKWPRKIISDKGFEVQILSRGSLTYKDNDRLLKINSEYYTDDFEDLGIAIYKNSIKKWNPPYENELIDIDKQNEIIENITKALEFKKIKIDII